MKIKQLTPSIKTEDLNSTIQFYTQVLGFELKWEMPFEGQRVGWLERGMASLMFFEEHGVQPAPGFTGTLYFTVDEVSSFYEEIRDRVEVVWGLEEMSYGTLEFGIKDNNGFYLAFAQNL